MTDAGAATTTPKMVGDLKAQWPVNFATGTDNPMATSTPQVSAKTGRKDEPKGIERPPSSVSRQFMPNKQKNASEVWAKHEEKKQDKKDNFGYTPFKTAPVNSGARAPQKMDVSALNIDGFSKPKFEPNGAISGVNQSFLNRSNSALGQSIITTRPNSRAASELNFNPLPSRYQSYCTLPRPEQIEAVDPATQIYGYGAPRPVVPVSMPVSYGLTAAPMPVEAIYGTNGVIKNSSRPGSAMMTQAATMEKPGTGMGFYGTAPSIYGLAAAPPPAMTFHRGIVNWSVFRLLCIFQFVIACGFLAVGIIRCIVVADIAVGVEIGYAALVLLTAVTGMIGTSKKNYSFACATFVAALFTVLLVYGPLKVGFAPLVMNASGSSFSISWAEGESVAINIALVTLCILQLIFGLVTALFGCQSVGHALAYVDELRLKEDYSKAFPLAPTKA
uniref:MARVEL domain-containing protein n=1 Tax=Steinernema glaseri TaxID=37863 RepID=A0A1I7ZEL4_9BILA